MAILNIMQTSETSESIALKPGSSVNLAVSGSSARVAIPDGDKKIVRLCSDVDLYYKLGDVTITAAAGDIYLPAFLVEAIELTGQTYIAAIAK